MRRKKYNFVTLDGHLEMVLEELSMNYSKAEIIDIFLNADGTYTVIYSETVSKKDEKQTVVEDLLKRAYHIINKNNMISEEPGCTYFDAVKVLQEIKEYMRVNNGQL